MPKFKLHKVDYAVLKAIFTSKDGELIVLDNPTELKTLLKDGKGENTAILSTTKFENAIAFSAICNPNGTIRWLFRTDRSEAGFLRLYNANNFKGWLFKWLVQMLYMLGLKALVKHGNFYVAPAKKSLYKQLEKSFRKQYSVFTGTLGPNRKLVIESIKDKQAIITKVPLSKQGEKLVENEANTLSEIKLPQQLMCAPNVFETGLDIGLSVSNIEPKCKEKTSGLSKLHVRAIHEFYQLNCSKKEFGQGAFYQKLEIQFKELKSLNTYQIKSKNLQQLVKKLLLLKGAVALPMLDKTSLMHGDFTPWNMFVSKGKLYVYDWELAVLNSPVFLDLIHYVFQNGVMVKQQNATEILSQLKKLEMNLQMYLPDWGLKFNDLLQWYLLFYGSYYANIYAAQDKLHLQAKSLLIVWEEVIDALLDKKATFPKLENVPMLGAI